MPGRLPAHPQLDATVTGNRIPAGSARWLPDFFCRLSRSDSCAAFNRRDLTVTGLEGCAGRCWCSLREGRNSYFRTRSLRRNYESLCFKRRDDIAVPRKRDLTFVSCGDPFIPEQFRAIQPRHCPGPMVSWRTKIMLGLASVASRRTDHLCNLRHGLRAAATRSEFVRASAQRRMHAGPCSSPFCMLTAILRPDLWSPVSAYRPIESLRHLGGIRVLKPEDLRLTAAPMRPTSNFARFR
jgi:hypothetical protein